MAAVLGLRFIKQLAEPFRGPDILDHLIVWGVLGGCVIAMEDSRLEYLVRVSERERNRCRVVKGGAMPYGAHNSIESVRMRAKRAFFCALHGVNC